MSRFTWVLGTQTQVLMFTQTLDQHTYYSLDLSKSYTHFQTPVLIFNEINLLSAL